MADLRLLLPRFPRAKQSDVRIDYPSTTTTLSEMGCIYIYIYIYVCVCVCVYIHAELGTAPDNSRKILGA